MKTIFSLEDIKKAIEMARLMTDDGVEDSFDTESISGLTELCTYGLRDKYSEEEIIQLLSTQQLPKEFEPRMYPKYTQYDGFEEDDEIPVMTPMTYTNSEGKQEIQGRYVY